MGSKMITYKEIKEATMWINDIDVSTFGVLVENFKVSGTPITNEVFQGRDRTNYNVIATEFSRKTVSFSLFFAEETRHAITQLKSKIDGMMYGKVELFMPDGFYYTAVAKSLGELSIIGQERNKVIATCAYTFEGMQHDSLQTEIGNTLVCTSTIPLTDCRLTCTASRAYASITIEGVTITNVKAGDVLTIDGINGRILQNGAPCAGNMSFINLPRLNVGLNTLSCPETLTVEYYPTYI